MTKKNIVVVGSLNLDLVASVGHLPATGETLTGLDFNTYSGGKGANQAVALGRLGASISMVGRLGSNGFAADLRANLESAGVDDSCVENVPGPSGTALITTSAAGENTIVVIPGANAALLPADLDRHREVLEQAAIVLGQLEIPLESTVHLSAIVHRAGIPFLLDPAPAHQLPSELLQSVTWFTPNETETRILIGDTAADPPRPPAESADRLLELGVRNVILKLGSGGVYLAGQDVEHTHVPAFQVPAIDTTAAGDTFNGAFAYALAERHFSPREAATFACAAAAISVTRRGAQDSMPTLIEVDSFLATHFNGRWSDSGNAKLLT
ncbi:MAG TPA: ribokinase [Terracidiphilus sp.]|nr:ribokinase [Terracidiphilus sp.]